MRITTPLIALLVFASGGAVAQTPSQTVIVQLSNFDFRPSDIQLRKGRTYQLRLINVSSGGHDFAAPKFFQASRIAPADVSKLVRGKVRVPKGQTVELVVTPEREGSYHLSCTHFMHSAFGMTGTITVR